MTFFAHVKEAPLDPILGLNERYASDLRENKVNLGAGVYKTADLKPFILNSVKKAENYLLKTEVSKDYLPIDGLQEYLDLTKDFIFLGENKNTDHIYGIQTVGGTAALRVGGVFLKEIGLNSIYLSEPTWANHHHIFKYTGLEIKTLPYFNWFNREFDFSAFIKEMEKMKEGSIVLLQVCCHNPTGLDPSAAQWEEICQTIKKRRIFPFFDFAYQGFGEGHVKDATPLSLFLESGVEGAIAVSHSKNFGIYGERCGALFFVCKNKAEAKQVGSQIKLIVRGMYSNPPCHGARIVSTILRNQELKAHWIEELSAMRDRIKEMRSALSFGLQAKTSASFDFLIKQKGMFSYTSLNESQVERLINDYGIYMPKDGRINIAGLNSKNLPDVINALLAVQIGKF